MKPEFWKSETIARLSREARLCFIGLWNYVDDEGRGVDNSHLAKAELFPMDDDVTPEKVSGWLAEIAALGLIRRYTVEERNYLRITNFAEHQRISHPKSSILPDEDGTVPVVFLKLQEKESQEGKGREGKGREVEGKATAKIQSLLTRVENEEPTYLDDYASAFRANHSPTALMADIDALLSGMHGPGGKAVPLAIVGQALRDCAQRGIVPTGKVLASFCANLMRPSKAEAATESPGRKAYRILSEANQ